MSYKHPCANLRGVFGGEVLMLTPDVALLVEHRRTGIYLTSSIQHKTALVGGYPQSLFLVIL